MRLKSDADLVKHLRGMIEKAAPQDYMDERRDFYSAISKLPGQDQISLLKEILGAQTALGILPKDISPKHKALIDRIEQAHEEERRRRLQARKRFEYLQRTSTKIRNSRPGPDSMLLVRDNPPHRPTDALWLCLWDLYCILNRLKLKPIYNWIATTLEIFCARYIEGDSVKRELMRLRKNPAIKDYERFKKTHQI